MFLGETQNGLADVAPETVFDFLYSLHAEADIRQRARVVVNEGDEFSVL